jgi:tRNA pseudouridine55 synthase
LNGIVVVDKPPGPTSHDVVARVRRECGCRVGHTGTLDPMASGVLVLCLGKATKSAGKLEILDKEYLFAVRLGLITDTLDAQGKVTEERPLAWCAAADGCALGLSASREGLSGCEKQSELCARKIAAAAAAFVGEMEQVPPAYSALKVGGRKSYELARAGRAVELAARKVVIRKLDVLGIEPPLVRMRVECSKGTYVRSLARDIGKALGCGGIVAELRRTRVGAFDLDGAVDGRNITREAVELALRPALENEQGRPYGAPE